MKRIVLWIEELMKTSFLWVCDLCSSISYPSAVPSSPRFLSPHLAASHSARLISFISSSPCCPVWASTDIQLHRAAQGCSLTPSWPSLSRHLLLPPPLPRPRSPEEVSNVWRPVKSESKWSIKWPSRSFRSTEMTGKRDVMMYPSVS